MALGFRKSFLGYNCEEVSEYIHKTQNSHKQAISALNENINDIKDKLSLAEENNANLKDEISALQGELDFYKTKYEEVKTLSENIGKLYLVAQTNAKSIIAAADNARVSSFEEIEENIATITKTNASLTEIKSQILTLSDNFVKEIEKLTSSLEHIKAMATAADENGNDKVSNFDKVFKSITE